MIAAMSLLGLSIAGARDTARTKTTASSTSNPAPAAGIAKIDPIVKKHIDSKTMAGSIVLAVQDGKVIHKGVYGVRDSRTGAKMTEDTIFRIYSMTKPITTVAAMMLWEEGKFKLDVPISRYLPELKDLSVRKKSGGTEKTEREITVRELMRHTSGFTCGFMGNAISGRYDREKVTDDSKTLADMITKISKLPLYRQPGTGFHYSSRIRRCPRWELPETRGLLSLSPATTATRFP